MKNQSVASLIRSCLVALVAILFSASAQAQVHPSAATGLRGQYFMVIFGYQGAGNSASDSHTFASFYRGDDLDAKTVRPSTISWLPTSHSVHPSLGEPGTNFSLQETLRYGCGTGKQVRAWGPYRISPELYRRAMSRIRELNSGRDSYSMTNMGGINCINAVGDIGGTIQTGLSWGFSASQAVIEHLSGSIEDYPQVNSQAAAVIQPQRLQCH